MKNTEQIKRTVKEKYSEIAERDSSLGMSGCCISTSGSDTEFCMVDGDYSSLEGYMKDADLGLGCGLPTELADIRKGDVVLDLGSGAGNDCFIARHETGPEGKVIGVDFSEAMIEKARTNAHKLGVNNVEFRYGDIEDLPVIDNSTDVVISNCVLNLVPGKEKAFSEIYRVLNEGGHFNISDVVLEGEVPSDIQNIVELYIGCVAGAIPKDEYLDIVKSTGFGDLEIQKETNIRLPEAWLKEHLDSEVVRSYTQGEWRVLSITLAAYKGEKRRMQPIAESEEKAPCGCADPKTCCN